MKFFILLSLFLCMSIGTAHAQSNSGIGPGAPGVPRKTLIKTIIVDNYYPYTFVNKNGEPDGFSVDLIKEIAAIMDYDLEIVPGKWEDARNALKAGTIDFLPMMAYSIERDRDFDFTSPHTVSYDAFFIRRNDEKIESLKDLAGKKIIVMKNDQACDYLLSSGYVSADHLIMVDSLPDALRLLSAGTGDTAFMPQLVGLLHIKDLKLDNIDDSPHVIDEYNRPFSIAVREGNNELLDRLKEGLRIINATGKYNTIYQKWFGRLDEAGISYKRVIKYASIVLLFIVCVSALLLFWNFSLKRRINAHTGFLKKEIAQRVQAEKNLALLNERFSLAIRAAKLGIWDWDIKENVLLWDDRMYELYGLQKRDFPRVYDDWLAGVHPDDREKVSESIQRALSGVQEYEIDFRVLWSDGNVRYLLAYGKVLRDDTGVPVRMTGINYDISDFSRAMEGLRTSEEKFSKVFFYSPLLMTISDLANGKYIDVNGVFCRTSGFSREECIGKSSLELGWISAEDRLRLLELLRTEGSVKDHELTLTRKNGKKIACLYFGEIITIQGKPCLISIAQDITERTIIEDTQKFLLQCSLPSKKEDFFESLAHFLSEILNIDDVLIASLEDDLVTARTVTFYNSGHFEENFSYVLKDAPCSEVVQKQICCFPRNVSGLFPGNAVLQRLEAESYIGITLWSSDGRAIGLISLIGKQPLDETKIGETVLNLVAPRAAGELENREAQEALREKLGELERFASLTADRELRMIELKKEINELLRKTGGEAFTAKPIDAIELETQAGDMNKVAAANKKQTHLNAAMLNMLEDLKTEIENRKKAEEKLKASLDEKEVLLRELYHRTKNNMNLISSYLQLQMMYKPNETTDAVFTDIISRIQSMALVHQKLYRSQNLSRVNFSEYISDLVGLQYSLTNVNYDRISVSYELEEVELLIDTAIPCGLVITELISNCFKHAFPQNREGLINIVLKKDLEKKSVILKISDDGVGLPVGFDLKNSPTLGMVTMIGIIEKQLKGSIDFVNDNGLKCMISFKDNLYTERV